MNYAEKELKKHTTSSSEDGGGEVVEKKDSNDKKDFKNLKETSEIVKENNEKNIDEKSDIKKNKVNEEKNEKEIGALGIVKQKSEVGLITKDSEKNILSCLSNLHNAYKNSSSFIQNIKKQQKEMRDKHGIKHENQSNISKTENNIIKFITNLENIKSDFKKILEGKYKKDDIFEIIVKLREIAIQSLPTMFMHDSFGVFGTLMLFFYIDKQMEALMSLDIKFFDDIHKKIEDFVKKDRFKKPEELFKILKNDLEKGRGVKRFVDLYKYHIAKSIQNIVKQSFLCGADFNSDGYKNTISNLFKFDENIKFLTQDLDFMKSINQMKKIALNPIEHGVKSSDDVAKVLFKKCNIVNQNNFLTLLSEKCIQAIDYIDDAGGKIKKNTESIGDSIKNIYNKLPFSNKESDKQQKTSSIFTNQNIAKRNTSSLKLA